MSSRPVSVCMMPCKPVLGAMESKPGTYALVLQSPQNMYAQIGRWGRLNIRPGYYIYVGSAFGPGGVLARVSRHCRKDKSKHWHIDYLREFTILTSVWYSHAATRLEHCWAETLTKMKDITPIIGFGCSDCKCKAHLFFSPKEPELPAFARFTSEWVNLSAPTPARRTDTPNSVQPRKET
jgi:Uri superfamily endonuclease